MDRLEKLIEAARQHGLKSDPDHEVGDLQDILRTCWKYLKPVDQMAVYVQHRAKVDEWL